MPLFPDAWMGELLSKNDIASIVSSYVPLKQKGGRLWGCCPFHSEKTPSFSVVPDKQFYYCFGCHAKGGVVQFIMDMEKLSYTDAIRFLADRAGMELPNEINDERIRKERAHREKLYAACLEAAKFFRDNLMSPKGEQARAYLLKRGLDIHTVRRFGLGLSPDSWNSLYTHLKAKGFTDNEISDAWLMRKSQDSGKPYDLFRGRVMFPIFATNGKVVAFGGRTMGNDDPKYLNSGETDIFLKKSILYALNMHTREKLSDIIVVEGYVDVISLYQAGIENAVASLGTSFTQQQARLMKRFVSKVYVCYDGDPAGQSATLRALDILTAEGLDARAIVIPEQLDPDDFVRKNGKRGFLALKDNALTGAEFKIEYASNEFDLDTQDGREGFAKRACMIVGRLQPVERDRFIPVIARRTGLSLDSVRAQCGLAARTQTAKENSITINRNNRIENAASQIEKATPTDKLLLASALCSKEAALHAQERMVREGTGFSSEVYSDIFTQLIVLYCTDGDADAFIDANGEDRGRADIIIEAVNLKEDIVDPVSTADDCLSAIYRESLNAQLAALRHILPSDAEYPAASAEKIRLQRKLESLK